ncbi:MULTISPECIES: PTS fructose transporter subunit IIC [unclassified Paludibacterium]|uniref:PTS fructose transporter subunit IIC n=1 Tax=unclassified Paludibacterium TaxID=2618429 RepID=UPI00207B5171|nr:fructose-specific PTS transporter subunit EIIC [Paludibacterium sp. B53371]BEV70960.1 fructose-specific PTS transporter subunit EIIC [Paludibacterium sp. THUN1379]
MYHLLLVLHQTDPMPETATVAKALQSAATAFPCRLTTCYAGDARPPLPDAHFDGILLVGDPIALPYASTPVHPLSLQAAQADPDGAWRTLLAKLSPAQMPLFIVAITSCTGGVTHTFMAAEGLEMAAEQMGHRIKVETQGQVGLRNTLTEQEIADADLVIIAADTQVMLHRFVGKRVYRTASGQAIRDGKSVIEKAIREATRLPEGPTGSAQPVTGGRLGHAGPYEHLMTGVSFMLPLVVAGGLIIALAFALGGIFVGDTSPPGSLSWALFQIGAKAAFPLMVPVLAGYIAYSIADRPGIAPGLVGGMVAVNMNAGFLGGIAAGFIAGYGTAWLTRHLRLPRHLNGLVPIILLPLLGTLLTGLLMTLVVGSPMAFIMQQLSAWLSGLHGSSALLFGALIGLMMAFDMGGPVNKAAYGFATALLSAKVCGPMAAVMAAGMTPPLGVALATWWFGSRFSEQERQAGKATAILGMAFMTEGAIPYAARDPLRVIPALMIGSAVTGALTILQGIEQCVPHGGIFILPFRQMMSQPWLFCLNVAIGSIVTALTLRLLKQPAT